MLANVQRCRAVPFVPINFTVPCTGVLSSATHLLAYRWSAGEIVLPGQSFHQWTHLGKETSAHLGPFTAQGYRIINNWSEIMAEVLSLKQFLRVEMRRRYISHLDRSILLSARIKLLCCGGLRLQKNIFMPRPNDIYRLCFVLPWTAVNFTFLLPTCLGQKAGKARSFAHVGWKRGLCHACYGGISEVGL